MKNLSKQEIEKVVLEALTKEVSIDIDKRSITLSSDLRDDFGFNSLDVTEVLVIIERKLQISVPDIEFDKINTVQDVIDCIVELQGEDTPPKEKTSQAKQENLAALIKQKIPKDWDINKKTIAQLIEHLNK